MPVRAIFFRVAPVPTCHDRECLSVTNVCFYAENRHDRPFDIACLHVQIGFPWSWIPGRRRRCGETGRARTRAIARSGRERQRRAGSPDRRRRDAPRPAARAADRARAVRGNPRRLKLTRLCGALHSRGNPRTTSERPAVTAAFPLPFRSCGEARKSCRPCSKTGGWTKRPTLPTSLSVAANMAAETKCAISRSCVQSTGFATLPICRTNLTSHPNRGGCREPPAT